MVPLLVGVANSRCAHMAPAPPVIRIHIHDQGTGFARCATSEGIKCEPTPMSLTGGWFMFEPSEWQKVQGYADLLICIIEGGCKAEATVLGISIDEAKRRLSVLKKTLNDLREGRL